LGLALAGIHFFLGKTFVESGVALARRRELAAVVGGQRVVSLAVRSRSVAGFVGV